MRIEPLTQDHLLRLQLQPEQENLYPAIRSGEYFSNMSASVLPCYAALEGDQVIGCFGTVLFWPGRGMVWTLLSKYAGASMHKVHRAAGDYLNRLNVRRLEAYVRVGFEPGLRWVQLLGFEAEGVMRCFFADGSDAVMFSCVRGE